MTFWETFQTSFCFLFQEIKQKQKVQEELSARTQPLPLPDVVPDGDPQQAHYGLAAINGGPAPVGGANPAPGLQQPNRNHGLLGGALANLFVIVGFAAFAYTVKYVLRSIAQEWRTRRRPPSLSGKPPATSNELKLYKHTTWGRKFTTNTTDRRRSRIAPPGKDWEWDCDRLLKRIWSTLWLSGLELARGLWRFCDSGSFVHLRHKLWFWKLLIFWEEKILFSSPKQVSLFLLADPVQDVWNSLLCAQSKQVEASEQRHNKAVCFWCCGILLFLRVLNFSVC